MAKPHVLIAGAGPTGLVLALWLTRLGVTVRIFDKSEGPGETSRAMAVQARTLELYRQIGLADEVVGRGIRMDQIVMRVEGAVAAQVALGDIGQQLSPYPFVLAFPQDDHERLLLEHLQRQGVIVERQTELLGYEQDAEGVRAKLRTDRGEELAEAAWLCGCDGAGSAVRHGAGIGFPGGTYAQIFYVADACVSGEAAEKAVSMCLSSRDFCLVLPVRSTGAFRLVGIVQTDEGTRESFTFDDVAGSIVKNTQLTIDKVNWFSTYRVHHRVADRFRDGRIFLAGDAGHVHSPAGGQGMNTGIGDAVNLAWKLAAVIDGRAAAPLLDSYEPERIAFARALVASTDRAFQSMTSRGRFAGFARGMLVPRLVSAMFRFGFTRRLMFRLVSQIRISYRDGPISHGSAGAVHGGDRLPWVEAIDGGNFAPLTSLDWQLHVYGEVSGEVTRLADSTGIALQHFVWSKQAESAGLAENAVYLVRPDGHVAWVSPLQDAAACQRLSVYLDGLAIKPLRQV
jgi:2-polyprenyl-6-methoxyphenol hydroxylase-like FAD-dependent oxidoreductase